MTAATPGREELLAQIRLRVKNARGAIESGQVTDKDVHGSLTKVLEMIDRLAATPADEGVRAAAEKLVAPLKKIADEYPFSPFVAASVDMRAVRELAAALSTTGEPKR